MVPESSDIVLQQAQAMMMRSLRLNLSAMRPPKMLIVAKLSENAGPDRMPYWSENSGYASQMLIFGSSDLLHYPFA